jgi:hypothetical protein
MLFNSHLESRLSGGKKSISEDLSALGLYQKVKLMKKMHYYKYLWCKSTHPLRPLSFKALLSG